MERTKPTTIYVYSGDEVVRAMPRLSVLLSNDLLNRIHRELAAIPLYGFTSSLSELRHVRRVPLKADAATIDEEKHMAQSFGWPFGFSSG